MHPSKIDPRWPNALRWFLVQGLEHFTPWHFISESDQLAFAARAFEKEDVSRGSVFVFAHRQDCDDFAGLEVIDGKFTDRVICFHPVFGSSTVESPRNWNIVSDTFDDVFEFVSGRVIPDMKDWSSVEDAADL